MVTTITSPHLNTFAQALDAFDSELRSVRDTTRRHYGTGDGGDSVISKWHVIDVVLDLRNLAAAGCMDESLGSIDDFLDTIHSRPGVVIVAEVQAFMAELRDIATS